MYYLAFLLTVMLGYLFWKKVNSTPTKKVVPYKIIKGEKVTEKEKGNKRVCAVVGGTGFVGSHVVNELVKRNEYLVYVVGRTFRPERTNPGAACLIQVDLQDEDGLTKAFEGVDSVINAAAIAPNAFLSAADVYQLNMTGLENVIKATKKARVKCLVHTSAVHLSKSPKNPAAKAFYDSFYPSEKKFLKANGEDGLKTCAIGPPNIVGSNNVLFDPLISGKMTSALMSDTMPNSFTPVEYVARALVNAERKLASDQSDEVAGKYFPIQGEAMSWKTLLSLPSWPNKISEAPAWMISLIAQLNVLCVKCFRKAPFGSDLCPGILAFIDGFEGLEDDESEYAEAQKVLEIGPSAPPMEEYIKELVDRYQARKEERKKK